MCPGLVRTNFFQAVANGRRRPIRMPAPWLSTTPEVVAARAVASIRKNQRLVVVTPLARLLALAKRLTPGLLDCLYRVRVKKCRAG